ncbi:MAG TPA: hypothetical protein VHB79_03720 [Polyangiaceae bacterium]|nr:hypothetical protein [Polyangiaceae bacterium]
MDSSSPHDRALQRRRSLRTLVKKALCFALPAALAFGISSPAWGAYRCPQTPSPPSTETYQGFLGRVEKLDGQELPYRLFVPKDYDPAKAYPLVLYLHHAGLAGTDPNNESGWDNCVHLTSEIGSGDDYGGVFTHRAVDKDGNRFDTQQRYPHFVLAPHANSPAYGFGGGGPGSASGPEHATRKILWTILAAVQGEFNIDATRLYVTGISMGCYGTWDLLMRSPGVFAAASPQSCRGDPDTKLLSALKDTPIWSMCGTKDSYFSGAQAMADGMKQVGATAFQFTAMEGVGHSINDRGYDYPGFIDWMFAQHLAEAPAGGSGGAAGSAGTTGGSNAGMGGASSAGSGGIVSEAGGGFAPATGGDGHTSTGGSTPTGDQGMSGSVATANGGSTPTPNATPSSSSSSSASCAAGRSQRLPDQVAWGFGAALVLAGWRRKRGAHLR